MHEKANWIKGRLDIFVQICSPAGRRDSRHANAMITDAESEYSSNAAEQNLILTMERQ